MKEKISVIIPVYKVEEYLDACINSIINQTYKNLEIILVDDGSPDRCGEICDQYANKDKRIQVIHKPNGGLSDARNTGIDIATGEYLCFVDSDDTVTNDYVEYMYNMIKKDESDLAISEVKIIRNSKDIMKLKNKNLEHEVLNSEQAFFYMLYAKKGDVCAYAKLYKKNLFDGIRFPKGKVYEDTATTYKIIDKCEKISYGNKECYFYYTRIGSISKKGKFNKNEYDYIHNTKTMLDFIKNKYPTISLAVDRYDVYSKLRILRMLICTKPRKYEYEKEILKDIKKKQKNVIKAKETPTRDKIALITLNIGLPIFKIVWLVYCKLTERII